MTCVWRLSGRKLGVTYITVGLDAQFFLSAAKRIVGQVKSAG